MIDNVGVDRVNQVVDRVSDRPGYELPLLLLLGFRTLIDDLHAELARRGHPELRPLHGFVFQAIGPEGTTAVELGRRLAISKQAAGKTLDGLERLGYVERRGDPRDARRKLAMLTEHGEDVLRQSADIFDTLRAGWAQELGTNRVRALEADLRAVTADRRQRLDVPGWFSGGD